MFTIEQWDALRERVLRCADGDERVVAGAVVGSLAVDAGGYPDVDRVPPSLRSVNAGP